MFCDGECGRLFHQKCHVPPVLVVPPDDVPWYCEQCEIKMAVAAAEKVAAVHGADRRSARTALCSPVNYVGNYKGRNLGGSSRGTNRNQLVHTNPSLPASTSKQETTKTKTQASRKKKK